MLRQNVPPLSKLVNIFRRNYTFLIRNFILFHRGKIMSKSSFLSAIVSIAFLCVSLHAEATVITGTSRAFGESVNLTITPLIGPVVSVLSGPIPTASGTAPLPYNVTNTLLSANVAGLLTTGVLTAHATSNVDGMPGIRTASADATVDNLSVLLGLITATEIQSSATVSGDFGAFTAVGTNTLTGLSVNGTPFLFASATPNFVFFTGLGLTVTLNEQILTGNGIDSLGLAVNAIDISFNNFVSASGILNGNIIISHSEASLTGRADEQDVPEPATLLLFASGMIGLMVLKRRSQKM